MAASRTYSRSCSSSSDWRATTSSVSVRPTSAVRWRASKSRWRQTARQYFLGRPVAAGGGNGRLHHPHFPPPGLSVGFVTNETLGLSAVVAAHTTCPRRPDDRQHRERRPRRTPVALRRIAGQRRQHVA